MESLCPSLDSSAESSATQTNVNLNASQKIVDEINALAPSIERPGRRGPGRQDAEFKSRLEDGEDLDDLLPEAFAVSREMAAGKSGERPYDVQLMGGIVLHEGKNRRDAHRRR